MLSFEWDSAKSRSNEREHGISFEEAQTVFFDEKALEFEDPDHGAGDNRFLLLGRSLYLQILVVCHCYRADDSTIRIISARRATPMESRIYTQRGRP